MSLQELVEGILGNLGVLFLLLFILFAGYKRWWVFGWYAKELANRNERLENRLDKSLNASDVATRTADKLVKQIEVSSE